MLKKYMFQNSHELFVYSKYINEKQKMTWRMTFVQQKKKKDILWNIDSFHCSL